MMTMQEQITPRLDIQPNGCWVWTGSKVNGYGRVGRGNKLHLVHRLVWQWLVGPIPEGLNADHVCRNRACCNPLHIDWVTPAENMRRAGLAVTKCRRAGHPYTPENTHRDAKGHKVCRACDRDRYHRRKVAA